MYQRIFGPADETAWLAKWHTRMQAPHLVQLAFDGEQAVGFKVGYALDKDVFYSWLGGVLPEFRGRGIAQTLIEQQHRWCAQQGYRTIRTKTLNRWKSMLILNLKNGFDIIETYTDNQGTRKIVLEKGLAGYWLAG